MSTASHIVETIRDNLQSVRERIRDAAGRVDRDPESVRLVAVTKYAKNAWVEALAQLQVSEVGENRPQQLVERAGQFADSLHWHLIGQLQRNKVRSVLPFATLIHSVDSMRLLNRIELIAGDLEMQPNVLLEVNVSNEATKSGFTLNAIRDHWPQCGMYQNLRIIGLMTMAPHTSDTKVVRETFATLRKLRDALADDAHPLPELSMGMSGDYEIAIEEGATLVRVGSRLYEGLNS